jgi:hypothetical protein
MDFHLTDAKGHSLSRYLGTTTRQLDFGLLMGMVDGALNGPDAETREELGFGLQLELAKLVEHPHPPQDQVTHVVNRLNERLEQARPSTATAADDGGNDRIATTVDLAARLSGGSILWVAVPGPPGIDRIVKFSYLGAHLIKRPEFTKDVERPNRNGNRRRPLRTIGKEIAISCCWRARTLAIPLLHTGREVRYHLDIRAPEGNVEMLEAIAFALPSVDSKDPEIKEPESISVAALAEEYPELLDLPDEWVGPESSAYFMHYGKPTPIASSKDHSDPAGAPEGAPHQRPSAAISDRHAHLYLGADGAPSHRVLLQLKLTGARKGLIQSCLLASGVIALLMWAVYIGLNGAGDHVEATVVILSIVPVVLGYVVVSPDEQPFEHEHLKGVRLMAVAAGALPIIGALLLVLTHAGKQDDPDVNSIRPYWMILAILSLLGAAGLFFSWLRAEPPKEPIESPESRS